MNIPLVQLLDHVFFQKKSGSLKNHYIYTICSYIYIYNYLFCLLIIFCRINVSYDFKKKHTHPTQNLPDEPKLSANEHRLGMFFCPKISVPYMFGSYAVVGGRSKCTRWAPENQL